MTPKKAFDWEHAYKEAVEQLKTVNAAIHRMHSDWGHDHIESCHCHTAVLWRETEKMIIPSKQGKD